LSGKVEEYAKKLEQYEQEKAEKPPNSTSKP
jgi:hypothetical protein